MITWTCNTCSQPIRGDGYASIAFAAIDDRDQAYSAWQARYARHPALTLDQLNEAPEPVPWEFHHVVCRPDTTAGEYAIGTERMDTCRGLLWWTAHLMEKPWIESTNWAHVIRRGLELDAA